MDWLRKNVLPVSMGGVPKSDVSAMTSQTAYSAPMAQESMGTLGGRRRRSHRGGRRHRKTKKHHSRR